MNFHTISTYAILFDMKYSKLFGKTKRESPRDEVSTNAKLLLRAGFIDKLMAGSFTLLPLGFRVVNKIENIIREEINKTGANEVLMPLLHPKSIWNETGRWDAAHEIMYQLKKGDREYGLSFTHEEIVLDLVRKHSGSFRDYPIKVYHFSTKFRDEPRAKSGILRGREFLMKDLYSLHETAEDLEKYYLEVSKAYQEIFKRLGLKAIVTEAAGGVFTDKTTHEFQVLSETGEDEIIYCDGGDFAQNTEIVSRSEIPLRGTKVKCPKCSRELVKVKTIEVGNIFNFGQDYSKKMEVTFTNEKGEKKYPYFGSYGIGLTRLIGTIAEVQGDEKGLVWPESVAPYQVHLVGLNSKADEIYQKLEEEGIEVLFDDRDVSAGEKFKDADLIGIPVRLVVSDKTHSASSGQAGDKVEFKKRSEEKVELISVEEVSKRLRKP